MMAWESLRRDQLELIAPTCSHNVISSIASPIPFEVLHHDRRRISASSDGQRCADTVSIDQMVARELATATANVLAVRAQHRDLAATEAQPPPVQLG